MNPLKVNKKNIWEYEQDRPILIIRDFKQLFSVPEEATLKILLARGILKWLTVRREIIRFKNHLKKEITNTIEEIRHSKTARDRDRLLYLRGYLKGLEQRRKTIRYYCHSNRWQVPDNDRETRKLLEKIS